jgi:hypothetical protein
MGKGKRLWVRPSSSAKRTVKAFYGRKRLHFTAEASQLAGWFSNGYRYPRLAKLLSDVENACKARTNVYRG